MQPKSKIRTFAALLLALALGSTAFTQSAAKARETELADGFQKKIDQFRENGKLEPPVAGTVKVTSEEVNAYFAQRRLKMPDGVKTVVFKFDTETVTGITRVDFDEITRQRRTWNPLMAIFTGVHDVEVVATTMPEGEYHARVRVESVVIDGVKVPRMAMQLFVDRFVKPKYPKVDLDAVYKLPVKLRSVEVKKDHAIGKQ